MVNTDKVAAIIALTLLMSGLDDDARMRLSQLSDDALESAKEHLWDAWDLSRQIIAERRG